MILRGLTLRQPWATAIAYGPKRVENRSWGPSAAAMRGGLILAIHAGAVRADDEDWIALRSLWPDCPQKFRDHEYSAILALARVVRIVHPDTLRLAVGGNLWAFGPKCWVLDAVTPLRKPIACGGGPGLWRLPVTVSIDLMEDLERMPA